MIMYITYIPIYYHGVSTTILYSFHPVMSAVGRFALPRSGQSLDPGMSVVSPADDDDLLVLNVGNGWEWMGMGDAGIIITSDYGLFPKIPC
jgi:hypothetical protein